MLNYSRYIFTICSFVLSLQLVAQSSDRDCIRMGNKYFYGFLYKIALYLTFFS